MRPTVRGHVRLPECEVRNESLLACLRLRVNEERARAREIGIISSGIDV